MEQVVLFATKVEKGRVRRARRAAPIAEIADIARDRKSKTLPLIHTDKH
jgi:hypothetical protein